MGDVRRFRRGFRPGHDPKEPQAGQPIVPRSWEPPAKADDGRIHVLICVTSLDGFLRWSIAQQMCRAMMANADPACPYHFETMIVNGMRPVEFARNYCRDYFMEKTNCQILQFWDADQEIPDNWPFLYQVDAHVVSGTTFCWVGNDSVGSRLRYNQYSLNDKGECFNIHPVSDVQPFPVPIVGTACMSIRREVFDAAGPSPFRMTQMDTGRIRASEDVNFCITARNLGFNVAVHPGVVFGHVKNIDLLHVAQFTSERCEMYKQGKHDTPDRVLSI
jgi:hypothetical protein